MSSGHIILAVGLFVLGTFMFLVGFHNFDLGHNMANMECQFDAEIMDRNNKGFLTTDGQMIQDGVNQAFAGFYLAFLGFLVALSGALKEVK